MAKYVTYQQHEPLRVPEGWSQSERKLIAQLEEILDDLYRRFGRLRTKDLGDALQTVIQSSADGVEQNATAIEQNAEAILLKADQTTVDALDNRVDEAELKITPEAITSTVRTSGEYQNDLHEGRNYILCSDIEAKFINGYSEGSSTVDYSVSPYLYVHSGNGKRLLVSFDIKRTDVQGISGNTVYSALWVYYTYLDDSGSLQTTARGWRMRTTDANFQATDADYVRITYPALDLSSLSPTGFVRVTVGTSEAAESMGTVRIKNLKTEVDEAHTAWSSAPEDGDGLRARMVSAETSITQNAYEIALKASKTTVDNILDGTTGVPKVQNSALTVTGEGISMTGGAISLSAEASLLLSSGGTVDINGASGSIDLGAGSQMSAADGSFSTLTVNGVVYKRIYVGSNAPVGVHDCFWAEPQTITSVSVSTPTPAGQLAAQGFNNNYGTPSNPHVFTIPATADTLGTGSIDYVFKLPLYRGYTGTKEKTLALMVQRGGQSILFPLLPVSVSYGIITWAMFQLTSSVNLFTAALANYPFTVTVYATAQNNDSVVIKASNDMTLTGTTQGGSVTTPTTCALYYIP